MSEVYITTYDGDTVSSDQVVSSVKVFDGGPGLQGPQGEPGPAGPKGDQGADGTPGATGPAGPAGANGAAGPQGPQGLKGDTGDVGPAGPAGADGAQGPAGPTGPKGDTGDVGPTGPVGLKGDAGATGPQGPAGADGPQGLKGDTGAQGPQGLQGVKGDTGTQGPQGIQGPTGPTGPTGATGPGVPTGGTTGQVLAKTSGADYATGWTTPSTGGGSLTVQDENGNVATSVTQIDFQGAGVTATAGTGEVVVTIPGGTGGGTGDTTWTPVTFKNNWKNYTDVNGGTFGPVAYRKDSQGFVHLRGLTTGGTVGSGTPVFTLPVGYRPAFDASFAVVASSSVFGRVSVFGSGDVSVQVGSSAYTFLDGITFLAEA